MRRWQLIGGMILIAEVGLLFAITFTGNATRTADGYSVKPGAAAIQFSDQTSRWEEMVVERVVTPTDAWLVVAAPVGTGGQAGEVYGRQRVSAGQSTNIRVSLTPKKKMPNVFIVTLVADRGQPNVFEFTSTASASGGGMGGGGSSEKSSASTSKAGADKQLIVNGEPVTITVREVFHDARGGTVSRTAQPAASN